MLKSIRRIMALRIKVMFARLAKGGKDRGVLWKWYPLQYRRKTDGARVPAFGGIPRIAPAWAPPGKDRGEVRGQVLGRLRPSGRRVTPQSQMMQDNRTMLNSVGAITLSNENVIRFGPTQSYAKFQNRLRPFMFFENPKDVTASRSAAGATYKRLMKKIPS